MKEKVTYALLYALVWPLSLLPLPLLYVLADVLYFLIYYVVRYRRKLVLANLTEYYPDRDIRWIRKTKRRFYRNFADYIVETIKLLHISDKEMMRRVKFENIELLDRLINDGKSVTIYFAHCGNWEWATSVTLHAHVGADRNVDFCQVYRPLRNKAFDRLMLKLRSRFGTYSLPKKTTLRELILRRRDGKITVTGFMSDQKPSHGDPAVPTMFLRRPTAFISGTETLARKLDTPVIYWDTEKIARGRYIITCRLLAEAPNDLPEHELTLRYVAALQRTIDRNPSIWLWTHNRWKNPVTQTLLDPLQS